MARFHPPIECTLYDIFEDDGIGSFGIVELLGVDSGARPSGMRVEDPASGEGFVLADLSEGALISLRSFLVLCAGSQRLDDALDHLARSGWTIDRQLTSSEGPVFRSLAGTDPASSWQEALETLRVPCLWSVLQTVAEHLLHDRYQVGITDLHRRPDGVTARQGPLEVIDSAELVEILRARRFSEGRGVPVLRVLPTARDRMAVALDMGLELSAEGAVAALCPSDPEASELGGPSDTTARTRAINNHRIILSRSRERIEDALIAGHAELSALVTGARRAELPDELRRLLAGWADETGAADRDLRRMASLARLAWLTDGSDAVQRVGELMADCAGAGAAKALRARLVAAEPRFWRSVAGHGLRPPSPWADLGWAGDSVSTALFLLRHVTWVRGEERPGLETLGAELTAADPGRQAGTRAARLLEHARNRLMNRLDSKPDLTVVPPSASPPASGVGGGQDADADAPPVQDIACRGAAFWPESWTGPCDDADRLRVEARTGLGQLADRRRPTVRLARTVARQLRGLREGGDKAFSALRWWLPISGAPGLGLECAVAGVLGPQTTRIGSSVQLRVAPPGPADGFFPVVVREVGARSEVLFPLDPDSQTSLVEFESEDDVYVIPVIVGGPAGEHTYVVVAVPAEHEIDWSLPDDERWELVRDGVEDGTLAAAAVLIVVEP